MIKGATLDETRQHRYTLTRQWGDGPQVCFIMLNPSTADENTDDATIRRCIGFAQTWGGGSLLVVNLFSLRSKNPGVLKRLDLKSCVDVHNDHYIINGARESGIVVAAWGNHGSLYGRSKWIKDFLSYDGITIECLAITQKGEPIHPLYQPADAPRQIFVASKPASLIARNTAF